MVFQDILFLKKIIAPIAGLLIFFILDRILKAYFLASDIIWQEIPYVSFHFVKNTGIAFSISLPNWLLFPLMAAAGLFIFYFFRLSYERKDFFPFIGLLSLIFGASSNFYDRVAYGYVIDYIDIKNFSVLNFSDIMITLGLIILLFSEFYKKQKIDISKKF